MRNDSTVGTKLRLLRRRMGLTLRALAERAGITPAMVSYIENGKASPSVVTLEKLLGALDISLADFFGAERVAPEGPVFPREGMQLVADVERSYTVVFPVRTDIKTILLDELLHPAASAPAFGIQATDVAGYVLSGELILEIQGEEPRTLRPGDAFYVPAGVSHRGYAAKDDAVRLITATVPPSCATKPKSGRNVRSAKPKPRGD